MWHDKYTSNAYISFGRYDILIAAFPKTVKQSKQSLIGPFEPEENITILRNAGSYLPVYTA